ncbi:MAG: disulfide reductase [Deltaproteobacteria bacterium]|nr:disulfide reductase [Deltaproteobacteria bacterium]
MDVTYYPGCSLESSARDYDESIRAVCAALDIRLHELPDWTCCGATSAHSVDEELAITLPALNLSAAEQIGNDVVVPCPLCFNRLKRAEDSVDSSVGIYDLGSFMGQGEWIDKIRSRVTHSLEGLRAVCYYGCMANRPPKITGSSDYENPRDMDNIAEALGVDVRPSLVRNLYDKALEAGAECIIVSCQMCQANLDLYQQDISKQFEAHYNVPVFYFTELIGLALGLEESATWLKRHMVDPIQLLKKKNLLRQ